MELAFHGSTLNDIIFDYDNAGTVTPYSEMKVLFLQVK